MHHGFSFYFLFLSLQCIPTLTNDGSNNFTQAGLVSSFWNRLVCLSVCVPVCRYVCHIFVWKISGFSLSSLSRVPADGNRKQPFHFTSHLSSLPRTPLMMAVENGHIDSSVFLIRNGAMVNARDTDGRTALHRAVSRFDSWVGWELSV